MIQNVYKMRQWYYIGGEILVSRDPELLLLQINPIAWLNCCTSLIGRASSNSSNLNPYQLGIIEINSANQVGQICFSVMH